MNLVTEEVGLVEDERNKTKFDAECVGFVLFRGEKRAASSLTPFERAIVLPAIDSLIPETHIVQRYASCVPFDRAWKWIGRFANGWEHIHSALYDVDAAIAALAGEGI